MKPYFSIRHSYQAKKLEAKKLLFKKAAMVWHTAKLPSKIKPALFSVFFHRLSSFSRARQFCAFSKKSRSVFFKFKMSRITFRDFVRFNLVYGVHKRN